MTLIAWAISFADDEWLIVLEMVSGVCSRHKICQTEH